jgi:drug/metabolite transporter (DMT)-like permease
MSRRAWFAFAAMGLIWGLPYLFMRVAVAEVSPVFVAWTRLLTAAVLLLPIAAQRGTLAGVRGKLGWLALLAVFYQALAFTMLPLAERVLPSSLTAIVIAGVPIVVTLVSLRSDRPSPERIAGLAIGFAGVAVLVGLDIGLRPAQLLAVGFLLVVLACYTAGPLLVKSRLSGVHPVALSATSAGMATVMLTPAAVLQWPARVPSTGVILSLLGLGVLCTAVAFVLWFFLIQEAGPARATLVTYVNPIVAVLAGAIVLQENVGGAAIAGMVLILGGSWLATRGGRRPAPAVAPEAAA